MSIVQGDGLRLRRAEPAALEFLAALVTDSEVEPYLAASGARDEESLRAEIERSQDAPDEFGRFVIEELRAESWHKVGTLRFELTNRRSRIASPLWNYGRPALPRGPRRLPPRSA